MHSYKVNEFTWSLMTSDFSCGMSLIFQNIGVCMYIYNFRKSLSILRKKIIDT